MSTTPPLTGFRASIDRVTDPHAKLLFNLAFNRLGNHAQAFGIQQAKINALQAPTASGGETVVESGGGGGVPAVVGVFTVNDQSGETAYTTQPGDNGALVVLSDASAIALTLAGATPPYGVIVANQGAGTVTVTPAAPPAGSSVISYAANPGASSMPLPSGQMAILAYDGVNWFAAIEVMPQSIPNTVHEWLNSYDATTGLFTATQPTVADVTGAAPIASPTFTGVVTQPAPPVMTGATTATSATAGAASALPATPAGYLQVSINGTLFKVPYYAV